MVDQSKRTFQTKGDYEHHLEADQVIELVIEEAPAHLAEDKGAKPEDLVDRRSSFLTEACLDDLGVYPV